MKKKKKNELMLSYGCKKLSEIIFFFFLNVYGILKKKLKFAIIIS